MNHTQTIDSSSAAPETASKLRCLHRWPSGRRCRQATEHGNSSFCSTHAAVEQNRHRGDRLYDLLQSDNVLLTAKEINKSLASLYFLLAADKISPRRAAVLAYISSLMLRTLPAVEKEEAPDRPSIILDLPRPPSAFEPTPDTHPIPSAADVSPALAIAADAAPIPADVVAGLQTRSADTVAPASPAPVLPPVARVYAEPRSASRPGAAAVTPPAPAPSPQKIAPATPSSSNPTPPQTQPPVVTYHDPNYDDHWVPTAHVIKIADELERQRFAPKIESPHQDAKTNARRPAA